jgi:hypothetical protein
MDGLFHGLFKPIRRWARLVSNQRPLACEARSPGAEGLAAAHRGQRNPCVQADCAGPGCAGLCPRWSQGVEPGFNQLDRGTTPFTRRRKARATRRPPSAARLAGVGRRAHRWTGRRPRWSTAAVKECVLAKVTLEQFSRPPRDNPPRLRARPLVFGALVQERRHALPCDTEAPCDLLHRQALGVESLRLGSTDVRSSNVKRRRGLGEELHDEWPLLVPDELGVGHIPRPGAPELSDPLLDQACAPCVIGQDFLERC